MLLRVALGTLVSVLATTDLLGQSRTPNVVLLFADDAGYADFGFQPEPAPALARLTPHIDTIAAAGVRFTNAYVSGCVCSPSRAGLLTGRYQQRFGHERNLPPGYEGGLPLDERTAADHLGALGLTTALVGKWHLGYPPEYHPGQRGFDLFHGLLQGSRSYFPIENPSPNRVIQRNGEPLPEVGYVTDRFGDAAVEFIEEHADQPFFLFLSFTAPHGPLQARPEDLEALASIRGERRRKYAALVKAMDDAVGRVLEALQRHGLDEHTFVVFTNDNGGQTQTGAINSPLRGRKGQLFEGGIRVPMAIRWSGRIPAGTTIDDPVITLDLLPTFVRVCGGEVSEEWRLDGVDLLPRILGDSEELPERPLFWRSNGPTGPIAMRRGNHKLLVERDEEHEQVMLFDLAADIGEQADRSTEDPERVAAMRAELTEWESSLMEPRWSYGRSR
jgi:arylsulfatase A-like enzyme